MSAIQQVLSGFNSSRNYATRNPSDKAGTVTLSNGNLTSTSSSGWGGVRATIGVSSGKWYWEISNFAGGTPNWIIGVGKVSAGLTNYLGSDVNGWGYSDAAIKYNNNSGSGYGASFTTGDVIGIALDMDAGTIVCYKNNVSQGTMFTGLTGTLYPMSTVDTSRSITANFGATAFTYSPPVGFNAGLYT